MNRRAVQTMVGALTLLAWGLWGANGLPTARLESLVNYPNPFDARRSPTVIAYRLDSDTRVTVRLFDLMGGSVREWEFSAGQSGARAGENRLSWDGTDEQGRRVAAGGYVCQVLVDESRGVVQGLRKIAVVG
jgi:hypothetical protein